MITPEHLTIGGHWVERRAGGPPVVFVAGAGGDAGYWEHIADALAGRYTVVTYDRRGNSRSEGVLDAASATAAAEADDAARLIETLDLAPAVVCGLSSGATYTVELLLRRPDLVRAAFIHEPALIAAASNPEQVAAGIGAVAEQGMAQGGPPAAMEAFLRLMCGDEVYEAFDAEVLGRVLGNSEVFFSLEMPALGGYLPGEDALRSVTVPCVVTTGELNADPTSPLHWMYETSRWLADRLGAGRFQQLPGAHVTPLSHPDAYVDWLRRELDAVY